MKKFFKAIVQEVIEHDELYQEMVAQYGPLEEVSTKTSYIVTDYVVNEEQTLSTEKVQTYDELPLQYRMYSLTPFNINPGGEVKKTFSIIELTLRFEKTNNSNK
ncbi:hypothetical protein D1159_17670 [Pseudoflavonifractor sp. 524-17]|uniref:hypothetical protein n=1 Tax=Pseudoflavonifractor sp. 524-17 TaxID=2304577 RepID=UPI00137A132E|nr:hypothetical protein [Pseudoflavonifractor sp. 524-17]NCE66348.1 hypothetical protein [Pseudoflavonifractor sp. 524-17]